MKKVNLFIILVLILPAAAVLAGPPNMREGKWEITVKMDMEGAPFPMPPMVSTHCVTKDDLKDAKKTLPNSSRKKDDCTVQEYKASGNKVTWRVQCKDGMSGTGEMVYQGDSYSGTMKMTTNDKKHGKSNMVQHIKGRRIGDCK